MAADFNGFYEDFKGLTQKTGEKATSERIIKSRIMLGTLFMNIHDILSINIYSFLRKVSNSNIEFYKTEKKSLVYLSNTEQVNFPINPNNTG